MIKILTDKILKGGSDWEQESIDLLAVEDKAKFTKAGLNLNVDYSKKHRYSGILLIKCLS